MEVKETAILKMRCFCRDFWWQITRCWSMSNAATPCIGCIELTVCILWRSWNCQKLKVSKHDVSRVFYQVSQAENTEGAGTVVEDGQTLHVFVLSFCTRGMKSIQMLAIREKNKRTKHLTWLLHSVFSQFLGIIWFGCPSQNRSNIVHLYYIRSPYHA